MTSLLNSTAIGASVAAETMRAAVIVSPGKMEVRDVAVPVPGDGEVRVRLEGCGVCASNIPPWEGRPWFGYPMSPGQLGHEGWGWVDAVGKDVTQCRVGQRVAMLSQKAYAQYDVAPELNVVALSDSLASMPFPAEPLGCAMNVLRRGGIEAGETVAIVGVGFLGAVLTAMLAHRGIRVIAISRRAFAQTLARRMGAVDVLPMDDSARAIEYVRRFTGGAFCDVVIEATGKQEALDLAGEITRERGRLLIAGYHQDGMRQVNMQLWNWRGLDVINAHERDPRVYRRGMEEAVAAVAAAEIDPSPLFTHRFSLEQLGDALDATRDRPDGFLKALIMM